MNNWATSNITAKLYVCSLNHDTLLHTSLSPLTLCWSLRTSSPAWSVFVRSCSFSRWWPDRGRPEVGVARGHTSSSYCPASGPAPAAAHAPACPPTACPGERRSTDSLWKRMGGDDDNDDASHESEINKRSSLCPGPRGTAGNRPSAAAEAPTEGYVPLKGGAVQVVRFYHQG